MAVGIDDEILAACAELNLRLGRDDLRPEQVDKRLQLLRRLEGLVTESADLPLVPDTSAGRIAEALWYKTHSEGADFDRLLHYAMDSSPLVRLTATEAIASCLQATSPSTRRGLLPERTYRPARPRPSFCISSGASQSKPRAFGLRGAP